MSKNKVAIKGKLPNKKTTKKEKVVKTKSSQPVDEMKSIMKDWHRPVYHSSSFSFSPSSQSNKESHEEDQTMCRICQSMEDSVSNQQVTPCGCSGSLQYVHMNCLRQWRLMQKAKNLDVSICELCKKPYNIQLLGETNVPTDNLLKIQEDLNRLVRSGIYLMLLVKTWKEDLATIHQSQSSLLNNSENSNSTHSVSRRDNELSALNRIEQITNETLSGHDISTSYSQRYSSNIQDRLSSTRGNDSSSSSSSNNTEDDNINQMTRISIKRRSENARIRRK